MAFTSQIPPVSSNLYIFTNNIITAVNKKYAMHRFLPVEDSSIGELVTHSFHSFIQWVTFSFSKDKDPTLGQGTRLGQTELWGRWDPGPRWLWRHRLWVLHMGMKRWTVDIAQNLETILEIMKAPKPLLIDTLNLILQQDARVIGAFWWLW